MPRALISVAVAALFAGAAVAAPPEVFTLPSTPLATPELVAAGGPMPALPPVADAHLALFPEPPGAAPPARPARPVLDRIRAWGADTGPALQSLFTDPTPALGEGWASAELLAWRLSPQRLWPLVTAGGSGVPGDPRTAILVDNDDLDGPRAGFRLTAGLWLDGDQCAAVEASVFALDTKSSDRAFPSAGTPVVGRPFFNAAVGLPDARLVGSQVGDVVAFVGRVEVGFDSDLWGFEVNYRGPLGDRDPDTWNDVVAGYRFLHLADTLVIAEQTAVTAPGGVGGLPPGSRVDVYDRFRTRNTFNGLQLGAAHHRSVDPGAFSRWIDDLAFTGFAKLAVGHLYQVTDVFGETTTVVPGGTPVSAAGGLLTGPNNIGRRSHNRVACIPEFGFTIGCHPASGVRLTAGYNLMVLCNFVRAGDQIDVNVGAGRPLPIRNETNVWVQGATLGVEFCW